MSNYGYAPGDEGWRDDRKEELAEELRKLLATFPPGPYVEVDGTYPGIRIRGTNYLSDDDLGRLVEQADEVFARVTEQ